MSDENQESLTQLVHKLQTEQLKKKDLVVPASCLSVKDGQVVITNSQRSDELSSFLQQTGISVGANTDDENMRLDVLPICHGHLADKTGLPRKHYDRLRHPESHAMHLYDQEMTHFLRLGERNFFLRMFVEPDGGSGVIRAVLSDKFMVIDNMDILMTALDAIKQSDVSLKINKCDLTESRMYVRFTSDEIEMEAPELLERYRAPDSDDGSGTGRTGIASGFVISNSEIGQGAFSVAPRLVVGACNNGMIFTDEQFRRNHLGTKMEQFSHINWSAETQRKELELINAQVGDAVKTFISPEYLDRKVRELSQMGGMKLLHPLDAMKNVCTSLQMSDDKMKSVLDYFVQGADHTRFGATQAITYFAHKKASPDEQHDLEAQAVSILPKMHMHDEPYREPGKRKRKSDADTTMVLN